MTQHLLIQSDLLWCYYDYGRGSTQTHSVVENEFVSRYSVSAICAGMCGRFVFSYLCVVVIFVDGSGSVTCTKTWSDPDIADTNTKYVSSTSTINSNCGTTRSPCQALIAALNRWNANSGKVILSGTSIPTGYQGTRTDYRGQSLSISQTRWITSTTSTTTLTPNQNTNIDVFTITSTLYMNNFIISLSTTYEGSHTLFTLTSGTLFLSTLTITGPSTGVTLSSCVSLAPTCTFTAETVTFKYVSVSNSLISRSSTGSSYTQMSLTECVFEGISKSGNGAVLNLASGDKVSICGGSFTSCTVSSSSGGAIYAVMGSESLVRITGVSFSSCSCDSGYGGAIYLEIESAPRELSLSQIEFYNKGNTAGNEKYGKTLFVCYGVELEVGWFESFITDDVEVNKEAYARVRGSSSEGDLTILALVRPVPIYYVGCSADDSVECLHLIYTTTTSLAI